MHRIEEAELLKALAKPKTRNKAFALLVNEYSKPLYWKIRSFVLSHDDADDVLQNTFLKVWKNIERKQRTGCVARGYFCFTRSSAYRLYYEVLRRTEILGNT